MDTEHETTAHRWRPGAWRLPDRITGGKVSLYRSQHSQAPAVNREIFVSERASPTAPFAPAAPLPGPVNGPNNDFCPTPLPDGELYFVTNGSADGCGSTDLVRTVQSPATGAYSEIENLGCAPDGPNTPVLELSPAILKTRWGTFLYFSTDWYSGDGTQDICRSRLRRDGTFGPCVLLPYPINTEFDDRQPNLSPDGRELVYASNRPSSADDKSGFDIFSAKRRFLFSRWRRVVNLSESVPFATLNESETRPSLSWDHERLYYGDGMGVWVSNRR